MDSINSRIAEELGVRPQQVAAAVALLDEGATVPFIARYRKEVTGGLDDIQLRMLEERLRYLRELEDRRAAILASITEQGKMTPELLERDIELRRHQDPPRRPVPAVQAEAPHQGRRSPSKPASAPLADGLLADPTPDAGNRSRSAYVDAEKGVADAKAALDGARHILMERFAEDADLLAELRELRSSRKRRISARVIAGKEEEGAKFRDYFELRRAAEKHAVAPRAGDVPRPQRRHPQLRAESRRRTAGHHAPVRRQDRRSNSASRTQNRPADKWLGEMVRWTWKRQDLHAPRNRPARRAARRAPRPRRSTSSPTT